MEDYDELTSYLRPNKKNNMVLGGLLAFSNFAFLLAGYLQNVSSEYSFDIRDYEFTFTLRWSRISLWLKIICAISSLLGCILEKILYWTICTTTGFLAFIISIMVDFILVIAAKDSMEIILGVLLLLLNICSVILYVFIIVAYVYRILVYGKDANHSLDLNDPNALMMKNIMLSIIHVIPGFGFFFSKLTSSTKRE